MLTFRDARPEDLPFIIALAVEDSVVVTDDDPDDTMAPEYLAVLAAIDADPNQRFVLAEQDGEPVGTIQLSFVPGLMRRGMWRALVEQVHISAFRRNSGLGTEMMRRAIEESRKKGCGMVQLPLTSSAEMPIASISG
ncbi:MAG: GNAT family N-acetyltransferase [Devosia sp.]